MNIKKKKYSIQSKTVFYILIFNVLILLLLWFCQVTIFDIYYEKYQIDTLEKIVDQINTTDEKEIVTKLEEKAYNNDVCIAVTSKNEYLATFNANMNGCAFSSNNQTVKNMMKGFITSDLDNKSYKFVNEDKQIGAVLYAIKYDQKYIFMYSNLKDISNVTILIKQQLMYISIIAIIIAVLISIFLGKTITDPITKITKKAKMLGKGDYDVSFDESNIKEIDELATTLTQAKNELGKTDELRRDLMANVSHDLKTPLTMIKAYAEMVRDISYKDKEKMNEHLDIIIDETDRLTVLVNDILNLSKLQAGKHETLNIEDYDLAVEINKIVKKYEIIKETEKYNITVDIPKTIDIKADKNKLNQVIYNLVNNAINYTGDDKVVNIKVTKVKKTYLVEITDTGKGIKKEELPYIWEKYYKNAKKHQRNVVSTGLGLSIVKQILEEHNFEYGVNSTPKKGSTFYFIIKI
ncbi:MAG: HAMP domain-containing sensor histidine kinase [Bacilli bacterium]